MVAGGRQGAFIAAFLWPLAFGEGVNDRALTARSFPLWISYPQRKSKLCFCVTKTLAPSGKKGGGVADEGAGDHTAKRRRKTGRPELAPGERMTETVTFRLTVADRAAAEANAARAGIPLAELARRAVTGAKIKDRAKGAASIPPGLLADLNRVGNNLNQIAHAAHLGRDLRHNAETALADLRALMDAIAARLSGDGA